MLRLRNSFGFIQTSSLIVLLRHENKDHWLLGWRLAAHQCMESFLLHATCAVVLWDQGHTQATACARRRIGYLPSLTCGMCLC